MAFGEQVMWHVLAYRVLDHLWVEIRLSNGLEGSRVLHRGATLLGDSIGENDIWWLIASALLDLDKELD